jgi:hypothetical protein
MLTSLLLALAAQDPQGTVVVKGDTQITLGGELRFRTETRDPSPAVMGADADTASHGRFRLSANAALNEHVRGFLQLQEVVFTDGTSSVSMVRQAFGELTGVADMADLQVGRFEMSYGDELLISPADWGATGKSFDGIRVRRKDDWYWADVFYVQPVEGQAVLAGVDQSFGGVYFGIPRDDWSVEAYALVRDDRNDGTTGTDDMTFGGRFKWAQKDGIAFRAEAAQQSGDHGALDAGGMVATGDIGTPVGENFNVGLNVLYASGDDDAADGNDDAFKGLYETPHKILGYQDLFRLTNVLDTQVYAGYRINGTWRLYGAFHLLSLAEDNGILPDLKGGLVGAAGESDLGMEVDLTLRGKVFEEADVWIGVSEFLAGDAIANGDDQLWAFVQLMLGF